MSEFYAKAWTGLAILAVFAAQAEVELQPIHAGLAHEYGQMRGLTYLEDEGGNDEGFTINRTIGWLAHSAILDDKLRADLVLGGLWFHFFPSNKTQDWTKVRQAAVSIAQASANYVIGDWEDPEFSVSVGILPYKYSESKNLGEYLFRSNPYPNTTINGGWDLIHSSYSQIKGIVVEKDFADRTWKNDLLAYISDDVYPLHDLNLAYLTSYTLGPLELGAGVNFYKILAGRPSRITPEENDNSYFDYQGETLYGDPFYYSSAARYFQLRAQELAAAGDAQGAAAMTSKQTDYQIKRDLVDSLNKVDNTKALRASRGREYYTFKGTLLMARFSLDLGSILGEIENFKLYGEADLLGLANYPIFFESRMERLPLMLGISIPTMGILDFLNVEFEYWENPYVNSDWQIMRRDQPKVDFAEMVPEFDITVPYDDDNFKWNVSAQKTFGNHVSLNLQVANDHTRPVRFDATRFNWAPYPWDSMLDSKAWYYVARLQVAY